MNTKKTELYFLFAVIGIVSVLSFFIFQPFLYAMILAVIFGTVCEPVHEKIVLLVGGRKKTAAFLSTLAVLLVVVIPVTILGTQIFKEATSLYFSLGDNSTQSLSQEINTGVTYIRDIFHLEQAAPVNIQMYAGYVVDWLIAHLDSIFSNLAAFLVNTLIFLFALYYVFKDGALLRRALIILSPLENTHDETILQKVTHTVNSVVRGSLSVACIQGILSTIGFFVTGIPNPFLWGTTAAIAALVPALGTGLVLVPAILFLFVTGKTFAAIVLFVWGVVAVGLVDNFIGPKLVGRGTTLHPFLVLLSIVGGVSFFGPLGFLFGPLVLSFLHSLIEIYFLIQKEN